MRYLALLTLACACACGCAKNVPGAPMVESVKAVPAGAARVFTQRGIGHGCLVRDRLFTAAHMVYAGPNEPPLRAVMFDDGAREGAAILETIDPSADLAILTPLASDGLRYGEIAEQTPAPGSEVTWVEYDYRSREDGLAPRVRKAKLLRRVAGSLILDEAPMRGASGGCLFDESARVIGIMVWGFYVGRDARTDSMEEIGAAVAIAPGDVEPLEER